MLHRNFNIDKNEGFLLLSRIEMGLRCLTSRPKDVRIQTTVPDLSFCIASNKVFFSECDVVVQAALVITNLEKHVISMLIFTSSRLVRLGTYATGQER